MFIIDLRNTRVSNYDFSVIGNNNVDEVYFYSHFTQYADGYKVYLKVHSTDERYVDKLEIASENISIQSGALLVKWTMGEVSTQCERIEVQLQFENNDGSTIAQSRVVTITLFKSINVDELIPVIYPKILKQLQQEIDTLTAESGAKVSLGYASDVFTINLINAKNEVVDTKTITIPTKDSLVGVAFADRVITFTSRDGNTQTVDLSDIYTKTEVDNLLAGKVDKTNESNKVYATDGSGNQTALDVDNGTGYSGKVARRDTSNQVHVPQTPTANEHATSKKYVDTLVANIKKDHYIKVDITEYPTLNDFLASTGEEGYLYLYPIDTSEAPTFQSGYYRYVWEDNAWLDLGTTQIDLSDYVDLSSAQTITGVKTFGRSNNSVHDLIIFVNSSANTYKFRRNGNALELQCNGVTTWYINDDVVFSKGSRPITPNTYDLGSTNYTWKDLYLSGAVKFTNATYIDVSSGGNLRLYANEFVISDKTFLPSTNNAKDLGASSLKWKDLYLAGNLYGANYSIDIDKVSSAVYGRLKDNDGLQWLDYYLINRCTKTADTTFSFNGAPTGCKAEYKALITNGASSPINLTFTNVTSILTNNDEDVQINGNVITLSAGTTIECSVLDNKMIAIVF